MGRRKAGRRLFSLGFLSGLAFTLFLRTEEGRKFRRTVQDRANELGEELGMQWRSSVGPLAEQIDVLAEDTERIAGDVAGAVKEEAEKSAHTAHGMWREWRASFRRGMKRARNGLES